MSNNQIFRIPDLIIKKRNGEELTEKEMKYFVNGIVEKDVQDCQLGAMLMSMFLQGLSNSEITYLTRAMMLSGEVMTWPEKWRGRIVDKHSSGGVGDKVSLILTPALAACGLKVPMVSGRGLSHTGGTLDKLESIPGFNVFLSEAMMTQMLDEVGCFIIGQSKSISPADKDMYAARDVTGTVNNIGLIAASIVSKKAAENLDALVLDVKCGKGAFFQNESDARSLAETMVATAKSLGVKTRALLTDMNAPLGRMVGNSLEVVESIQCLNGEGPSDLMDLVLHCGGELLYLTGAVSSTEAGCQQLQASIDNGSAMAKFRDMMVHQGVKPTTADALCDKNADCKKILPTAKHVTPVKSELCGTVHEIDAMKCAVISVNLGAGRQKVGESISFGVGLELTAHIGTVVKTGDILVNVHHDCEILDKEIIVELQEAFSIRKGSLPKQRGSLVLQVIS